MPVPFSNSISITTGPGLAPVLVNSSVLCAGLNADLLDGNHASAFAAALHLHGTDDITSGTFLPERLGGGAADSTKFLAGDQTWRFITTASISDASDHGKEILGSIDPATTRSIIEAAASTHTHVAPDIIDGVFDVRRLGSGAVASGGKVLFGSSVSGSSGQWQSISISDVAGAGEMARASIASAISGRLAHWESDTSGAESLGASPIYLTTPGFVGIASPFAFAVDADQLYIGGVKFPRAPSDTRLYSLRANGATGASWELSFRSVGSGSVSVVESATLNTATLSLSGDDASPGNSKLYGTNASGVKGWYDQPTGGGSTPPTTPANAVYVWVVNATATGGDWLQLLGAE